MRPAVRRSIWVVSLVAGLVMVLAGAVWIGGNTDVGRRFIERLTYRLTAGHVVLAGLGGTFPSRLTLERLELKDDAGIWLSADHIAALWSPLALIRQRIEVADLTAARVHMERTPQSGKRSGGSGGSIPDIEVGHFDLDVVELGAPLAGAPTVLTAVGALQLRSLDDAVLELAAHRTNGDGQYQVHFKLDPTRMDGSLSVQEPANGPLANLLSVPGLGALSATIAIKGPRTAEEVDAEVNAGEARARVHGSVDLIHRAAELDYSLTAPALSPRPDVAWNAIKLQGNWQGSLDKPKANGTLEVNGLSIAGTTRLAKLAVDLSADAGSLTVRSTVDGLEIPGPNPKLFAAAPLKVGALVHLDQVLRPLELSVSHPLFTLRGSGDLAPVNVDEHRASAELIIPEVQPFASLGGQDVHGGASLKAQLTHTSAGDALTMEAALAPTGGTAGWLAVVGSRVDAKLATSLSTDSIKIQSLRVAANEATLTASGSAARTAGTGLAALKDLQARWQLEVLDLARLSPDTAGTLKASGQLSGQLTSMAADAELATTVSVRGSAPGTVEAELHARGLPSAPTGTLQAHGMLDGAPLKVDATVERAQDRAYRVSVRDANWKTAHIDGDITVDPELARSHGRLQLNVGQLGDFDRLIGATLAGSVDGRLSFVPAHGRTEAQLVLDAKGLAVGQIAGDAHLEASGPPDAVAIQLNAQLPRLDDQPAALSASGVLNTTSKQLRLEAAAFDYRGATLKLLAPALVTLSPDIDVNDLKLGSQGAVLEVAGVLAPTPDLTVSITHVDQDVINVFAPGFLATGLLEGHAKLQGSYANPTGTAQLDVTKIQFADDAATGLPAVDLHAHAQLAEGIAAVDAKLTAGSGSHLTASGNAPLNPNAALDLKIGGKLDVGMINPLLEAHGLHAAGALTVDATVTGTSGAPVVGGGITLAKGSLRDYGRGVNLSDITAEIIGNEGGLEIKSFNAKAASGSVSMAGTFEILQKGMPLDLKITAKNAQPIASTILTATLDANLRVNGTVLERLDVAGTVHVNRATIGIPNSLPPDVAVLDVRRRGKKGAVVANGKQLIIGLDVTIQAPQQILVQGRGLDAELGGEIKLSGTTDEPQASGGFDLQRGSFTLVGNRLNFTDGRVSFDGAGLRKKIDPSLDFTAQTTVSDSTVILKITGPADAPRFEFTSNPSLPQDDIMARLLFGENAAQLSALQLAQIGAALATLSGVGSGSSPLTKLQKSLGLDRLTVGSNTTTTATGATENSGAAIAAGRYVSKRVYIEGKQTTAGTSQVQVDVDLTKHLKLQTRLGNGTATTQGTTPDNDPGSSIGISYEFEY